MKRLSGLMAATALAAGTLASAPLLAQTIGMVADIATHSVTVFNASTNTVLGSVALPGPNTALMATGDCSLLLDGTTGFVADTTGRVYVIDLTTLAPSLASGTNPIPIANSGQDTAITPDEKFLIVVGGTAPDPLSVIDIATRTQIGTASITGAGNGHNSVDVCSDGSILATSHQTQAVHRATINGIGAVTATAESLASAFLPRNAYCAPSAKSGVLVTSNDIQSFTIPGLTPVDVRSAAGAMAAAINPAGDRVCVRLSNQVAAYRLNSTTRALGATPLFTIATAVASPFPGIDQIAISPDGGKLYVGALNQLSVFDANTGAALLPLTATAISRPTGVCFARAPLPATEQNLDKFLMYKLADTEVDSEADDEVEEDEARKVVLAMHDEFDGAGQTRRYAIKETLRLGNPADVNDEGIVNEDSHLVAYKIHRVKGTPRNARLTKVKVANMFGELLLDTKQPNRLMLPSALSRTDPGVAAPANSGIDSFKCYRAGVTPYTPSQPAMAVSIVDEFNQPRVYNVLNVVRLCNPVDVDGTGIGNASGHLVCYGVERAKRQAKTANVAPLYINNALGPLTLGARGAVELCVPSAMDMSSAEVVPEPVKPPKKPKK